MIRYLLHQDINKERWDACVSASMTPLVYGLSWYLDITSPNWEGLVLNDYQAVMPLPFRRKWGMNYSFQPPFSQQLGVFGQEDANEFLMAIPKHFKLIDQQLNYGNIASGFTTKAKPNLVLDLNFNYDELKKAYSNNTIRNIRKAEKNELIHETTSSPDKIISLFKSYRGKSIATLSENDYHTLRKICNYALLNGILEISTVKDRNGALQAGAVFLKSLHGWIFLFSATHPDGRNSGAMSSLIDRFIAAHAEEPTILDFEGSSDPDLYRFYQSFGSKESVYLQLRINRLPFPFNLFKPSI